MPEVGGTDADSAAYLGRECVRAAFEGLAIARSASHSGSVEDVSYDIRIDRITTVPLLFADRASAGERLGQSVLVPDFALPLPGEVATSPHPFRNVAILDIRRDSSSNRVTGWLVADHNVPPPVDVDHDAGSDGSTGQSAGDASPAWNDADELTVLDGITTVRDVSGRLGSVSCYVRDAGTGVRHRGLLELRTAGSTSVASMVEFEVAGVTFLGPPGAYVADVSVDGYAPTQAHFTIAKGIAQHIDVLLEAHPAAPPICSVELRWDQADPALDLHVLHLDGHEVLAHTWFGNRGTLDHWPFCEYSTGLSIAEARARVTFRRLVNGPVRCAVFMHSSSSVHLASFHALGARLTILNADGSERRSFSPPYGAGNLWIVTDLLGGEPLVLGTVTQADEEDVVSVVQRNQRAASHTQLESTQESFNGRFGPRDERSTDYNPLESRTRSTARRDLRWISEAISARPLLWLSLAALLVTMFIVGLLLH